MKLKKNKLVYVNYIAIAIVISLLVGVGCSEYFELSKPINGVTLSSFIVSLVLAVGIATLKSVSSKKGRILTVTGMCIPFFVGVLALYGSISVLVV